MAMMNGGPGKRTVTKKTTTNSDGSVSKTKFVEKAGVGAKYKSVTTKTPTYEAPRKKHTYTETESDVTGKRTMKSKSIMDLKPGAPGGRGVSKQKSVYSGDELKRETQKSRGTAKGFGYKPSTKDKPTKYR